MSDYLWDKQGEPDPEVERLETLLRPLAYRGVPARPPRRRARHLWISAGLLAMAALVALLTAKPWRPHDSRIDKTAAVPPRASWAAIVHGGAATCDDHEIKGETRLPVGAWIETGSSHAELRVADIGTVDLEPGTRARIVETGPRQHRMQLDRGALRAEIDAPPRLFVVETKHAVVTDLGCAFRLAVDESGQGQLVVTAGKVALTDGGAAREVVVPAGAECALTEHGPGTPFLSDERLRELDRGEKPRAKPRPKSNRSTQKTPTTAPAPKVAPLPHSGPARKAEPSTKIDHDALKEIERSIP